MIRAGVITEKEVNSMLMYLNIMSSDSTHTEKFVYNFADINILRELKRSTAWDSWRSWVAATMRCVYG